MSVAGYVSPYRATAGGASPKILTVGDSIMHGAEPVPSASPPTVWDYVYHGGYRKFLYQALVARGRTPTMMGGLANATDGLALSVAGLNHNGNNGSTTANWVASYWATYKAANWDGQGTPTIICLATGANDGNTQAAGQKIGELIDLATAAYPFANVLVSTRTAQTTSASDLINAEITAQVATKKAKGANVQLVDAFAKVPLGAKRFPDGVHPSPDGYALLGDLWVAAIAPLVT